MVEPEKIEPCPFCGQYAALKDDGSVGKYTIECVYCDARGSKLLDPHEVIARWNRAARSVALLGEAEDALAHMLFDGAAPLCDGCRKAEAVLSKIRKERGA